MTERRTMIGSTTSADRLVRWAGLALAGGRTALGVVAVLRPELPARPWIGATTPEARVLARALGGRDLALGVGGLWSLWRADRSAAVWAGAAALADATDVVATALAWSSLPKAGRVLVAAAAGGAAVVGGVAATRLAGDLDA